MWVCNNRKCTWSQSIVTCKASWSHVKMQLEWRQIFSEWMDGHIHTSTSARCIVERWKTQGKLQRKQEQMHYHYFSPYHCDASGMKVFQDWYNVLNVHYAKPFQKKYGICVDWMFNGTIWYLNCIQSFGDAKKNF